MEVTSSAGSDFSMAGCCALAKERKHAIASVTKLVRRVAIEEPLFWYEIEILRPQSISPGVKSHVRRLRFDFIPEAGSRKPNAERGF
jgi:hypothetical protein